LEPGILEAQRPIKALNSPAKILASALANSRAALSVASLIAIAASSSAFLFFWTARSLSFSSAFFFAA
jgi:hypothetical protein